MPYYQWIKTMAEKHRRYSFKITVVGEGGVGKTSLIQKFTKNTFNEDYLKTIGANFSYYDNFIDNDAIRLIIWDIAGQNDFNFLMPSFLKDSRASIIVYSLEDNDLGRDSFNHIADWHEDVRNYCGDIPILLFVNKSDLVDPDQIDHAKIQAVVDREKFMGYHVTSAKNGDGVIDAFNKIIEYLYKNN